MKEPMSEQEASEESAAIINGTYAEGKSIVEKLAKILLERDKLSRANAELVEMGLRLQARITEVEEFFLASMEGEKVLVEDWLKQKRVIRDVYLSALRGSNYSAYLYDLNPAQKADDERHVYRMALEGILSIMKDHL